MFLGTRKDSDERLLSISRSIKHYLLWGLVLVKIECIKNYQGILAENIGL